MHFFIVHMLAIGTDLSVWACQVAIHMVRFFLERRDAAVQRINDVIS